MCDCYCTNDESCTTDCSCTNDGIFIAGVLIVCGIIILGMTAVTGISRNLTHDVEDITGLFSIATMSTDTCSSIDFHCFLKKPQR